MDKTNRSNVKIIFIFATLTIIALSIFSFVRIKRLNDSSELVTLTQKVKLELERTFQELIQAESSLRGYLNSNDSIFLKDFYVAVENLDVYFNTLDSLTKDNLSQLQNLLTLRALTDKKLDYMRGRTNKSQISYNSSPLILQGKLLMDEVREQVDKMSFDQERLIEQRAAQLDKETFITPLATFFLILSALIILVLAYLKITQELKISGILKLEIEDREKRIQHIFNAAPDAVITIDHKGNITNWNAEAETLFGWNKSEAIGKTLTETIIPERYRQQHDKGMQHYLKTNEGPVLNKPIEIFSLRKDKKEFPIELKISSSKLNKHHPIFIGFIRDISKRKQTETALLNQTNQLMEAQQLAHIGSWEWDVLANKIDWSDELFRIYGLTPQEFEADYENYLKYIHPEDKEFVNGIVQNAFRDQQPFYFTHKIIRDDGIERIISSTGKVFTDANGNTIRMAGTAQDVTEQKEYEAELKESEERLQNQNQKLAKLNKELEAFAYISSHDLQEPLRKIQTYTSRILTEEHHTLTENSKLYFDRMQYAAHHMETLIKDLLKYSRTNTTERKFENVQLSELVDDVKNGFGDELSEKQGVIESTDLGEAHVIPFQFRQMLHNLIGNAIKFSKPGQSPHIKITSDVIISNDLKNENLIQGKKYCHITVSDCGIGFEPQFKDRIFEMFQRLHEKKDYEGTGMGLAIVKKIIENHNGIITATGELNKGARFDIYIPV